MSLSSSAAIRQRRHRQLERAGRIKLMIEVDEHALAKVLQDEGLLAEDATGRDKLAAAVERVLALWSNGRHA